MTTGVRRAVNQASSVAEFERRSNEMAEEIAKGKTPKERTEIAKALAKKYGVSIATARRASRNKQKLGNVSTSTVDRSGRVNEIVRQARLGIGPNEIAQDVGVTSDYVSVVLRKNNISARSVFKQKRKIISVARKYGFSKDAVSKAFGVDKTTVDRSVKDFDIELSDLSSLEKGQLMYTFSQYGISHEKIAEALKISQTLVGKLIKRYSEEFNLDTPDNRIIDTEADQKLEGVNTEMINLINNHPQVLTPSARSFLLYLSNHSESQAAEKFAMRIADVKINKAKMLEALRNSEKARPRIKKPPKLRYSG